MHLDVIRDQYRKLVEESDNFSKSIILPLQKFRVFISFNMIFHRAIGSMFANSSVNPLYIFLNFLIK